MRLRGVLAVLICAALPACSSLVGGPFEFLHTIWKLPNRQPEDVYERAEQRAEVERVRRLEAEVERLHADLEQAEQALISAESDVKQGSTRADAVSALAEARVQLERARMTAPWRKLELEQAQHKLEEAERQIQAGHFGGATFFASRAQRMLDLILSEARSVYRTAGTRWVSASRANVRAGPSREHSVVEVLSRQSPVFPEKTDGNWLLVRTTSGSLGWIHKSLLD